MFLFYNDHVGENGCMFTAQIFLFISIQQGKETAEEKAADDQNEDADDSENAEGTTVFVKNLNFETTEETLKEVTGTLLLVDLITF